MTREEFTNNARQICDTTGIKFNTPTNEEMKLIDYVYMYHPSISDISGKNRLLIYMFIFGMRLIRDMRNTAHAMEDYEIKERKLKAELSQLKEHREAFIQGVEVSSNA